MIDAAVSTVCPRPARYRFVALGVVWSAYLVVFLSRLCVGPLAPFIKESFSLTNAQIGALTSATAVTYAPTLLLAGWLADRLGARRALVIGTLITGIAVGAVALAPSYVAMLLLLGASGLGCGFIFPTAVKAIVVWFPPRERATAVGVNQSAVNVSGILGAAIMPALALSYGWRSGFVVAALLALSTCVLAVVLYRDPVIGPSGLEPGGGLRWPRTTGRRSAMAPECVALEEQGLPCVTGDEATDRATLNPGFLAVARSRDILLLGLGALCLNVVEFSALAHLVLFLQAEWAYTAVAAGGLLALCQATGAVGKPLSGLISDRLLAGRRQPVLVVLAVLAGLSCVALALAGPGMRWTLAPALGVLGVGAVGWGGLSGALAGEISGPAAAGAAAGMTAAINNIGIFIGPPLFGFIVDRTGAYAPAWWAMTGAAALAVVLLALVREPRSV